MVFRDLLMLNEMSEQHKLKCFSSQGILLNVYCFV